MPIYTRASGSRRPGALLLDLVDDLDGVARNTSTVFTSGRWLVSSGDVMPQASQFGAPWDLGSGGAATLLITQATGEPRLRVRRLTATPAQTAVGYPLYGQACSSLNVPLARTLAALPSARGYNAPREYRVRLGVRWLYGTVETVFGLTHVNGLRAASGALFQPGFEFICRNGAAWQACGRVATENNLNTEVPPLAPLSAFNGSDWNVLEFRYTESRTLPRLSMLVNGVTIYTAGGLAEMPAETLDAFFFRPHIGLRRISGIFGGGEGRMEFTGLHFTVREL